MKTSRKTFLLTLVKIDMWKIPLTVTVRASFSLTFQLIESILFSKLNFKVSQDNSSAFFFEKKIVSCNLVKILLWFNLFYGKLMFERLFFLKLTLSMTGFWFIAFYLFNFIFSWALPYISTFSLLRT